MKKSGSKHKGSMSSRDGEIYNKEAETSMHVPHNEFLEERANTSSHIELHTSYTHKPNNSSSSRSPTSSEDEETKQKSKGFILKKKIINFFNFTKIFFKNFPKSLKIFKKFKIIDIPMPPQMKKKFADIEFFGENSKIRVDKFDIFLFF